MEFTRSTSRDCPSCGHGSKTRLEVGDHMSGTTFTVAECTGCGLLYLSDPPVPTDLGQFYANDAGAIMHKSPSALVVKARSVAMRGEVKRLASHLSPGASVLDIGAGDGSLVRVLRAAGFAASAADIYPAAEWSVPEIPYFQYDPSLPSSDMIDLKDPVDAVTMRHVLEHVYEPKELLQALAAQGVRHVSVVVPNADSRLARRLGASWFYWDPPRHLTFFTSETLRSVAEAAGYRIADLKLVGLDEVVTSLHRTALLRTGTEGSGRAGQLLTSVTRPTGMLASASSALCAPLGTATIKAVLTLRDR